MLNANTQMENFNFSNFSLLLAFVNYFVDTNYTQLFHNGSLSKLEYLLSLTRRFHYEKQININYIYPLKIHVIFLYVVPL